MNICCFWGVCPQMLRIPTGFSGSNPSKFDFNECKMILGRAREADEAENLRNVPKTSEDVENLIITKIKRLIKIYNFIKNIINP